MQLDKFVNVMGINVIQVIDQIQSDKNGGDKKFIDSERLIDKNWFKKLERRRLKEKLAAEKEEIIILSDQKLSIRKNETNHTYRVSSSLSKRREEDIIPTNLIFPMKMKVAEFPSIETKEQGTEKDKSIQSLRSRVWQRPRTMKWCKPKDFLSNKVKTYSEACELVKQNENGVIVRVKRTSPGEHDEFFNLDSGDNSVDFITFIPT
eukprot:TCONS_00071040-protein